MEFLHRLDIKVPLTLALAAALAVVCFWAQVCLAAEDHELLISAASSLQESLQDIGAQFEKIHPGEKIRFNFGSSGALERQLEEGAPSDIFISASPLQMDRLIKENLISAKEITTLAKNRLVIIVPSEGRCVRSISDLLKVDRLSIGDPSLVPAGTYAREALQHAGIFDRLQNEHKMVFGESVRQVLAYVEGANVDAGIVYATDARIGKGIKVCLEVPPGFTSQIIYPVAVLERSRRNPQVREFMNYLLSTAAKNSLKKCGFQVSE